MPILDSFLLIEVEQAIVTVAYVQEQLLKLSRRQCCGIVIQLVLE